MKRTSNMAAYYDNDVNDVAAPHLYGVRWSVAGGHCKLI